MTNKTQRIHLLDELRGFAIICMVIHHFFYDLGFELGSAFGTWAYETLCTIQPIFWALFILISGICSRLSRSAIRRGLIVSAGGVAVTLVTAVLLPAFGVHGAEIYCGILSCLGICMIVTGALMPLIEKIDWRVGLIVTGVLFFFTYGIGRGRHALCFGLIPLPNILYSTDWLAPFGFYSSSFRSADYFPLFPWIFLFLFGAFLGKFAKEGRFPRAFYKSRCKPLQVVGKNTLWVYLLHQPVLYGIVALIGLFQH